MDQGQGPATPVRVLGVSPRIPVIWMVFDQEFGMLGKDRLR
jgi:hypothetical protein